jgi:DNA sulfur modification protein DndC
MSKRIKFLIAEIKDQYLYDENKSRPWIVGFSGGKDSTVLLELVWLALKEIPSKDRKRDVFVVCNDTLVENPIITHYVDTILKRIKSEAVKQGLPIFVDKTLPKLDDTFWVRLIGKGYPAPNNLFRWCTERLKISPTSRFITDKVNEKGEAIILLGTRSAESQTRAQSIKKFEVKGKRLSKHQQLPNTYTYAPLKDMFTEEVWWFLNNVNSPWGADNKVLYNIYADASADDYECPTMIVNKNSPSCGQSRFGCWVCTVVKEDKSMTALIKNGNDWLKPLLEVRNWLAENRNIEENREKKRRNGSDDSNGPYTPKHRAEILAQVLTAQRDIQKKQPEVELITHQELVKIQVLWLQDVIFHHKVSEIYNAVYNKNIEMKDLAEKIQKEEALLKRACTKNPKHFELIQDLLQLQKNKTLMLRKRGLLDDIESRIEKYIIDAHQ